MKSVDTLFMSADTFLIPHQNGLVRAQSISPNHEQEFCSLKGRTFWLVQLMPLAVLGLT